ncbi:hypothetical protein [Cryobacterium zongtaii]|uniref:hypothetical protein n=2 Tax=Cryobacterium TaxID=69578 RepID=UPI001FAED8A5|nr:hypothetical protein [Cryobacterium zongtaii]
MQLISARPLLTLQPSRCTVRTEGSDMWTSSRRSGATHRTRSPLAGVVVALLACAGFAACTAAAETPAPAPTAETETTKPLPATGAIDAGTYVVYGFTAPFEVTVPDGWESFGWGVLKDWEVFVNFLSPGYVPTDACAWQNALVAVDPSPEAFVAAMTAQASTETTPPVEVVMGDYSGFEFDYSVESGININDCGKEHVCLWSEQATDCTRGYSMVTERETERVLDLNGELALFAVGEFQSVTDELTEEARAVFDSIEFVREE